MSGFGLLLTVGRHTEYYIMCGRYHIIVSKLIETGGNGEGKVEETKEGKNSNGK